ncbi:type I polyketide synthase [Actinomadura sp. NEAU-AAG7]|uniref:type I polyketide synthase n=1 Tax=Actinomadura sp. NEAU-AAG7 TaxID=2839640 RepID=UPI001BE4D482|nr:type I polyketide synthase [Actinomadura sp. NEAU-AAG7]MBT2212758.1 SDR family NAD(P)-dependent oxidoreductase [Actinomadura sp. NEAU-AAG7]
MSTHPAAPGPRIAIIGMACRYPDAASPRELWENTVAGRRAFRRMPAERTPPSDYWDRDPAAPDRFYARTAAVIEGYAFDRVGYKIAGSTYRSTDPTHWLALDTAARALADAGLPGARGVPRDRACVIVGNTLTGEFTRANTMRLRWPYVRRTVAAALAEQGWDGARAAAFLDDLEGRYKSPFPGVDEDTLAGGLSNTIAGRVCNYFDLGGGGYTVDGACSSSLLSVATACRALVDGDADLAIGGGVDLSLDPFELVGFAKTGALATGEMRVYDRNSTGFWPGEGCGMVVLVRERDALAAGHRVYATVAGWGMSSDGGGGITRPEVAGYRRALDRAYARAGFGIGTVPLFEGHGTGTPVGDTTELTALSAALSAALTADGPRAAPAAIGSVKGVIGHTKAAAGVAGLIKAAMALHEQVIPPAVGCVDPHPLLDAPAPLRAPRAAEPWPDGADLRAGVTSMGFGGINTHLVLESAAPRRGALDARTRALASSAQDAELLLLDGASADALRDRLTRLIDFVPALSRAQLRDLAGTLHRELRDLPYRAAVVASSPDDAERRLRRVLAVLDAGEGSLVETGGHAFLGHPAGRARIGLLFPGQGTGGAGRGGALRRRLAEVDRVYLRAARTTATGDGAATAVAQPRVVTGSAAALAALAALGVEASVAAGHSLGEITALRWAGAMDETALLELAAARGQIMTEHSAAGTMAGIAATPEAVARLGAGLPVVVAGYNGPSQTVIAGPPDAVAEFGRRAEEAGTRWTPLPVSHAFHSPQVAPAARVFGAWLAGRDFAPLRRRVVSTVTGAALAPGTDVRDLLRRQITAPVLFAQAVELAAKECDLLVEAGPGRVLTGLAAAVTDVPVLALDPDDERLGGLLQVAGAAFVLGAPVRHGALFAGRPAKPLEIGAAQRFLSNPCETGAPPPAPPDQPDPPERVAVEPPDVPEEPATEPSIELLRRLAAERAELPVSMVADGTRLLDGLHLSSITVGQIVAQVARRLGHPAMRAPTNLATATLRELAEAIDGLAGTAGPAPARPGADVAGAASWVRAFRVDLAEEPVPERVAPAVPGTWRVHAPDGHPLAGPLRAELERADLGPGVLVCLPPACAVDDLAFALEGAREAAAGEPGTRFVLVQHGRGGAGLAKTLRQEAPHVPTTVVDIPPEPWALARTVAEVAATSGCAEVRYGADGTRRVPTLRVLPVGQARTSEPLGAADVLLVTGGGKGITAEAALALARESGARLALLGRSAPGEDPELAANLERMAGGGATVRYEAVDITDPERVRAAVGRLSDALGPVTAVLHGAGRNEPGLLTGLDLEAFRRTLAPKVGGLRAVLDAVDPARLKLLVAFGSILGLTGLRGEAHYATANEWLADLTREVAARHPRCRTLCLQWSVWSGVGMGERLDVAEALARDGITPITPDQGVRMLRRLVTDPDAPVDVVVSGRTGDIDTVRREAPEPPLLRFADRPLVRYHGAELVTEVDLNAGSDPYLADHRLDGDLLFPAVLGMEAMAQVASAATGRTSAPVLEDVEFLRPVAVPPGGTTTIRVAATVTGDDTVETTVRSAETGFAAEHFRARLRYTGGGVPQGPPGPGGGELPPVELEPSRDLYGDVLFQGGRFRRLRGYHRLAARHVDAEVAAAGRADWFAPFLPARLLLGDPGMRDALMHGNQVCVPDATLLPLGVDRLHPAADPAPGTLRYSASERRRDGDTHVYDLAVRDAAGRVVERWEGLRLRAVRRGDGAGPWAPPLLGPFIERAVEDLLGARVAVTVEPDPAKRSARRAATALAASRTVGRRVSVGYRPDGRPEIGADRHLSSSHGAGVTLCAVAGATVGCDVETVAERPAGEWDGLLGRHSAVARLAAAETGEGAAVSGTRVWAALECLAKAGLPSDAPLNVTTTGRRPWLVLSSGTLEIATLVTRLRDVPAPVVFAVLAEGRA